LPTGARGHKRDLYSRVSGSDRFLPKNAMELLVFRADYLRARQRNRFLLTAPPLRLPGAVGSPATPVATV